MSDFDHAVIAVMDRMDEAVAWFTRLGFSLTARGYHTLGSINHLAVFGSTYLELLGYEPGQRQRRAELWTHPPGMTGLALRAPDARALHDRLGAQGVPVEALKAFSRPVAFGEGSAEAQFRTFQLAADEVPAGRIFFCQHLTPHLVWQQADQAHANGATEIAEFLLVADDLPAARRLFSFLPLQGGETGLHFTAGPTRIRLMSVEQGIARLGPDLPRPEQGFLRMAGLGIRTSDLRLAQAALQAGAIAATQFEGGLLVTPGALPSPRLWFTG